MAAVVAYHLDRLPGGWVGVDVFFVLSGYLITTLLLQERRATGRLDLRTFWARRARRLLPAALVCITATVALGVALEPDAVGAWARTGAGSALWAGNWQQVLSGGSYFDGFATPNALKHLWSLSVEEQLYVVWPLVVAAVVTVVRRRAAVRAAPIAVAGVAVALAAGSAVLMAAWAPVAGADPSRVWYGTDTRALTPLAGAALAGLTARGWPARRWGRVAVLAAGAVGAATLVVAAVRLDDRAEILWRGGSVGVALAAAAVVAAVAQPGRVQAALGAVRPAVWAGSALSYSLYLWHWPVIVLLDPERVGMGGWALDGLRIAVAVALAALSWWLVEQPVRSGALRLRLVGAPAMALALGGVALVAAGCAVIAAAHPTTAERMTALMAESGATPLDPVVRSEPVPAAERPLRVSLFGDSVAWSYSVRATPGVLAAHRTAALYNHTDWGCQLVVAARRSGDRADAADSTCSDWPTRWSDQVAAEHPDVAVLSVGVWEVFDRQLDGQWLEFGAAAFDAHLDDTLDRALTILASSGARVAVTTAPYPDRPSGSESPAEWIDSPSTRARFDHLNQRLRAAADRHDGVVVDLASFWCPALAGPCSDDPLRYDGIHFEPDTAPPRILGFVLDELRQPVAAPTVAAAPIGAEPPSS